MADWDILAILFGVFVFGMVAFVWFPARGDARRRRQRYRRMHSQAGDSGQFDSGSDYGSASDGGGGDSGGD